MNRDWLDQYKGVEYLKNKKERDWKFIIGMIVLLAIFAVMGGAFWNMVGKQAQMVREEEQKEEANAISAIYIETGEFLKTGVFVDLNNGTIFSRCSARAVSAFCRSSVCFTAFNLLSNGSISGDRRIAFESSTCRASIP